MKELMSIAGVSLIISRLGSESGKRFTAAEKRLPDVVMNERQGFANAIRRKKILKSTTLRRRGNYRRELG